MYPIMSSANSDILLSLLQFHAFYFFFFSDHCGRTSNTVFNRSGESGQPCLVPDLSEKAFRFCPLSMMLAVGLSYVAFSMLRYLPSIPTLLSVVLNGCRILSNAFSAFIDMIV